QFEVNTTIRFTPNDQKKKKKGKAEAPRDDESDPTSEELRAGEDEEPSEPDMEGEDEDRGGMPTPEVKTTMRSRRPKST
ncbi:MAG TPA: hypothetical protein VIF62_05265, partial [Labilithrix sp.]